MASTGLGAAALAAIGTSAWLATRGFDRTDEGLYLNAIAHPGDDRSTILLFGYAYHPLYVLVGGDVVLLRWAGLLLSVVAIGSLAWVALGTRALVGQRTLPPALRGAASLGLGATALTTIAQMPSTPSYNTLALQGLSLTATGLVLAVTRAGSAGTVGAALVGVGGWVTFLAKPTTAALLAAIVLAAALALPGAWRRRAWATIVAAVASAILALLLGRVSPTGIIDVLSNGLATSTALGGHDDLVRWDAFPLRGTALLVILAAGVVATGVFHLADRASRVRVRRAAGAALGSGFVAALVLGLAAIAVGAIEQWDRAGGGMSVTATAGAATILAACGAGLVTVMVASLVRARPSEVTGTHTVSDRPEPRHLGPVLVGVLILLPPAYALGTNLNLWTAQGRAGSFWVVALCVLLLRHSGASSAPSAPALWTVPVAATLTLLTAMLVATAVAPYRYQPLRTATTPTQVGSGTVRLTPADHQRVAELAALAKRLGVDARTRVLDLTGDSPGSIFLLGARPVGQAWILGGYPGSESAARLAIEHDRCGMRGALLFVAEDAPRALPAGVLDTVGLDLHRDYEVVGVFHRARSSWARSAATVDTVTVHRPRHGLLIPGCSPQLHPDQKKL
ncbi:hypothetical protein ACFQU3_03965 [Terrabacter sp. GCM10028922]|uniref:hypothetical protein n=1 Tax=Terrabacter sp. GCM10028922 TaxID=3273428 RepID=UPI00361725BE